MRCKECDRRMWKHRGNRPYQSVRYGAYGKCQPCYAARIRRQPMPEGIRKYIEARRRRGIPAEGIHFQGETA